MVEGAVHTGGKAWQQSQYVHSQEVETNESLWAAYLLSPVIHSKSAAHFITKLGITVP